MQFLDKWKIWDGNVTYFSRSPFKCYISISTLLFTYVHLWIVWGHNRCDVLGELNPLQCFLLIKVIRSRGGHGITARHHAGITATCQNFVWDHHLIAGPTVTWQDNCFNEPDYTTQNKYTLWNYDSECYNNLML